MTFLSPHVFPAVNAMFWSIKALNPMIMQHFAFFIMHIVDSSRLKLSSALQNRIK